jgi:hypothetical protein
MGTQTTTSVLLVMVRVTVVVCQVQTVLNVLVTNSDWSALMPVEHVQTATTDITPPNYAPSAPLAAPPAPHPPPAQLVPQSQESTTISSMAAVSKSVPMECMAIQVDQLQFVLIVLHRVCLVLVQVSV